MLIFNYSTTQKYVTCCRDLRNSWSDIGKTRSKNTRKSFKYRRFLEISVENANYKRLFAINSNNGKNWFCAPQLICLVGVFIINDSFYFTEFIKRDNFVTKLHSCRLQLLLHIFFYPGEYMYNNNRIDAGIPEGSTFDATLLFIHIKYVLLVKSSMSVSLFLMAVWASIIYGYKCQ